MIKAIETSYKGYRFRSRLEARWAVVFDHLGLDWKYEHEGYTLPDGTNYLPDFYFPSEIDIFAEVKGVMKEHDLNKIEQLSASSYVFILSDLDNPIEYMIDGEGIGKSWNNLIIHPCPFCNNPIFVDRVGFLFACTSNGACKFTQNHLKQSPLDFKPIGYQMAQRYYQAIEAGKSARFEHGESG